MCCKKFWSSSCRYVDFLFTMALSSDACDSEACLNYARFLSISRSKLAKRAFYLLRAVCASHKNIEAAKELRAALVELNLPEEVGLLDLWISK